MLLESVSTSARWSDIALPLRSVETPVAYKPLDATANEPPKSTTDPNQVTDSYTPE
jgi:hypothetical protein